MNCDDARDALLEADLGELRSIDSATPLGEHLAGCAQCRTLAAAIAMDTSRLGVLVDERHHRRRRLSRRRGIALLASLPIAAALIVAISTRTQDRDVAALPATSVQEPVARQVSLTVAPGQRATVLKTADPNVTVIWLSPGEGQ